VLSRSPGDPARGAEGIDSGLGVSWPSEGADVLLQQKRLRPGERPPTVASFDALLTEKNVQLTRINEPTLTRQELIGGRLYTGPCFVKYNAVLRGIDSDVDHLRKEFVRLCCSDDDFKAFRPAQQSTSERCTPEFCASPAYSGSLTFELVRERANTFTTTLHAVNSVVLKLSKLTVAIPVYRGLSDRSVPREFWIKNEFGVKGGVESVVRDRTRCLCSDRWRVSARS